ncbi:Hypothetical predicted protein [Octopus vulgaris]|uniref:Reverse transcriptase domain-containing protein n=1 Tax=Octopus vulgaris TaxID=6645 RepID=A0AA36BIY8_OCTVU|nr:Hypothetical predicted protein [Octopus vulgaris]
MKIKRPVRNQRSSLIMRIDVDKLKVKEILQAFQTVTDEKLSSIICGNDIEASCLEDMQNILNSFSDACKAFGLTISITKTELIHQPKPNSLPSSQPVVYVDGKALKTISSFTYLGSIVSDDAKFEKDIQNRISKASEAFVMKPQFVEEGELCLSKMKAVCFCDGKYHKCQKFLAKSHCVE